MNKALSSANLRDFLSIIRNKTGYREKCLQRTE